MKPARGKKVEMTTHASRLRGEAKRIRAEAGKAGKAGNENTRDELAEIAVEYERIAAKVERLEFEVRERKSSDRDTTKKPDAPRPGGALRIVARGAKKHG